MLFLNTEETYKMLQPFLLKEELNANTKAIRHNYKEELYGNTYKVLDVIHRYAVKFPGVCYLSKSSIAERLNISARTVIRACNKLEDLGIIAQYEMKRHRGDKRQSSNAIVFLTQVNMNEFLISNKPVTPDCQTKETPAKAPEKELKNTDISITEMRNKELQEQARKDSLLSKVPNALKGIGVFFSKVKDIYDLNGTIFRAKNKVSKTVRIEDHENLFRQTIANVFEYWKRKVEAGNKDYNVFALMYKAIKELTEKIVDGTAYATPVTTTTDQTIATGSDTLVAYAEKIKQTSTARKTEKTPDWFVPLEQRADTNVIGAAQTIQTDDLELKRQRVLAKLGLA